MAMGVLPLGFLLSAGLWLLAQHRGLSPSPQLVPAASAAPFGARRADIEFFAGSWKPVAGAGPRSPADCAPSPGSAGTPSKKNSSAITRSARAVAAAGLWIQGGGTGPQRARRSPGRSRARLAGGTCTHLLARLSLLALNGLRVPEATGADIEALGIEHDHRTLVIKPASPGFTAGRSATSDPGPGHGSGGRTGPR